MWVEFSHKLQFPSVSHLFLLLKVKAMKQVRASRSGNVSGNMFGSKAAWLLSMNLMWDDWETNSIWLSMDKRACWFKMTIKRRKAWVYVIIREDIQNARENKMVQSEKQQMVTLQQAELWQKEKYVYLERPSQNNQCFIWNMVTMSWLMRPWYFF